MAGDGEDRGRTSGLAVEGGGVPAPGNWYHITSTNQYHADMEHMFDDVRSRVCGEVTFSFVLIEGAYKCLHF